MISLFEAALIKVPSEIVFEACVLNRLELPELLVGFCLSLFAVSLTFAIKHFSTIVLKKAIECVGAILHALQNVIPRSQLCIIKKHVDEPVERFYLIFGKIVLCDFNIT